MRHVLAVGGSNMAGRGTGGPALNGASPLVEVWNNVNEGGSNGTGWIAPPAAGAAPWDSGGGNNSALWFCDRLAKEWGEEVRLVLVAQGSLVIADIQPPGDTRYVEVKEVYQASGAPPADILLWNNGDPVLGTDAASYEAGFLAMLAGFVSDGLLKADAPIIVQGLVGSQATLNSAWQSIVAGNDGMYFAPSDDLRVVDADHLVGVDLFYMGFHRCWRAYHQHTGPRVTNGAVTTFL